jgi:hypothetical protein
MNLAAPFPVKGTFRKKNQDAAQERRIRVRPLQSAMPGTFFMRFASVMC